MSMHSDGDRGVNHHRGVDFQRGGDRLVGLHGGPPLPSLGESVVSALSWPASSEARLVTRQERNELRARAERAGLLWIGVPAASAQQRGQIALVIEAAVEEQLSERGAGPAGFGAATNLEATLSDQLYRARSVGATGLVLMFDTLARLANLAGALDAEDSAVLRWWLRAASEKRVRLLFDVRDRYLGIYTRPVALETLLTPTPSLQLDSEEPEPAEKEELTDWLTDEPSYSPADLARALKETSPPPPPARLSSPPPPPPRASASEGSLEQDSEATSPIAVDSRAEAILGATAEEPDASEASRQLELGLDATASPVETSASEADSRGAVQEPSPAEPQEGGARQLAFRSVLAALEALEHEELEESPLLPDSDWQAAADESHADAPAEAWNAEEAARAQQAEVAELTAEEPAVPEQAAPDSPEPVAVPDPSPSSDGFTAMLTQEESPLPTRAIHYDSSAPSASFERSEYHDDPLDRSSRAPEVAPIEGGSDAPEASSADADSDADEAELEAAQIAVTPAEEEALHTVVEAPVAPIADASARLALVPHEIEVAAVPSLEVIDGEPSAAAPEASPRDAHPGDAQAARQAAPSEVEAEHAEDSDFELVPEATWQAWMRDLEAARGPKPLAVVERLFTSAYMPLVETRLGQPLGDQADAAIESWGSAFAKSYSEAFDALRIRGKRPTMVLDVPDIALRHGRMHGARQAQLVLVDALRFDLGQMVHEHLKELAGRDAACVERLLLWSALPANTATQLELLGRGPQGLREPVASERDVPVARGRAASTLRRVRAGHRDVMKLDLVESRISEPGAVRPAALWSLAAEVAEVLWDHMAGLPPRTLVMIFGDHGFRVDPKTNRVSHSGAGGSAGPEEVMVPGFAWLTGSVH